jgi:hypothetical protein
MVELLSIKVKPYNTQVIDKLTQECFQELAKDGKITKSIFAFCFTDNSRESVQGYSSNYSVSGTAIELKSLFF